MIWKVISLLTLLLFNDIIKYSSSLTSSLTRKPTYRPTLRPNSQSNGNWYKPAPETTWYIQYSGTINYSAPVTVYNLDLFDTTSGTIQSLKNQGKKVICYFSAGSYEDWRPDINKFPPATLGNNLNGWPGERFVDIRDSTVVSIMKNRTNLASQKGCDGVDPDNVDLYATDSGFPITSSNVVTFLNTLATHAHNLNLSIGLKNAGSIVSSTANFLDFAVIEECVQNNECNQYSLFVNKSKAVFAVEYTGTITSICQVLSPLKFSGLKKTLDLDAWTEYCFNLKETM